MSDSAFVAWALAPERTVEEQYLVELMVEVAAVDARIKAGKGYEPFEESEKRRKARRLNPAYRPKLNEKAVVEAEACMRQSTYFSPRDYRDRPLRDLTAIRFFPHLKNVSFSRLEGVKLDALAELPVLEHLTITVFGRVDLRGLEACTGLTWLHLRADTAWPVMPRLTAFPQLQNFSFYGNLMVCETEEELPTVTRLLLSNSGGTPLRDAKRLVRAPAVEYLTLRGLHNLDGIETYANAGFVSVEGDFVSLEPLKVFQRMTHLELRSDEHWPLAPLAQCAELRGVEAWTRVPRDYSALLEVPKIRELKVEPCTIDASEVAQLNHLFDDWGLDFLKEDADETPREPSFYLVKSGKKPSGPVPRLKKNDFSHKMLESFSNWFNRRLARHLQEFLHPDDSREMRETRNYQFIELQHPQSVDQLERLVEEIQWCLRTVKVDSFVYLILDLDPSAAWERHQERSFREPRDLDEVERRDEEEFKKRWAEMEAFKEREYRMKLREESGLKIDPEEFAPTPEEVSEVEDVIEVPFVPGNSGRDKPLHAFSEFRLEITAYDVRLSAKDRPTVEYFLGRPVDGVEAAEDDAESAG